MRVVGRRGGLTAGAVATALLVAVGACSSGGGPARETGEPGRGGEETPRPVAAPTFTGAGSEPFCERARAVLNDLQTVRQSSAREPDDVRKLLRTAQSMMSSLAAVAPGEIKADTARMVDGYRDLSDRLEEVDFDTAKLATGTTASRPVEDPDLRRARDRVDAYYRGVCGLSLG